MEERGLGTGKSGKEWVEDIASRKVDNEDFEEVVELLRSTLINPARMD